MEINQPPPTDDLNEQAVALVRTLHETERRLLELTAGEVDAVVLPAGESYLLGEAQKKLRESEIAQREAAEIQSAILNALPAHIALIDPNGIILTVNESWRRFATANVLQSPKFCVGQNYFEICERATGDCSAFARDAAVGIRRVLQGDLSELAIEYPCHSPSEQRWFRLMASPVREDRMAGAVVMHVNITERKRSESRMRRLVDSNVQGVLFWSTEGKITGANDAFLRMVGYTREELEQGRLDWSAMTPPEYADLDRSALKEIAATGACTPYEKEFICKDGSCVPILIGATTFEDDPENGVCFVLDISPLKHVEKALQESEAEFRILAEAMPQIVWTARADGWFTYLSPQWMLYTGLTSKESLGHGWSEPFHPDDRELARNSWQRATATGGSYSIESRLRRADGTYRWWLIRGVPQQDATGKVLKWFGTCTDIHDLKQAEFEVSQTNRALEMLSACNEKMIRAEHEKELLDEICRIVAEIGGYRMAWVGFAQDDEDRIIRPVAHSGVETGYLSKIKLSWSENELGGRGPAGRSIRSGQPIICEDIESDPSILPWLHLARERGYRSVTCLPLRLEGRTFGLLGLHSADVQKLRTEEIALLQNLADDLAFGLGHIRTNARVHEQAALLDIAREAILVKDLEGRILYWNKGAERTYGWSAAESVGRQARELMYTDTAKLQEAMTTLLSKGEWQGEMTKNTKAGKQIIVEVSWTLLLDKEGAPKSVLAIDTDITERKKLEQQFLRVQRMESIGTLAGGIAHDLNNSLAPILMAVEILREKITDDASREILETLETSALHGAELVKQVLTFARGIEGQRIIVNLVHLLQEIQKIIRDTFPKNIEFSLGPSRDLWTVTGDPTQLHQVFTNLCVNARDALPHGGKLRVTMENVMLDDVYAGMNPDSQPGAYVLVKVIDTGTGMPPEISHKIFEPFFTTKEIGKGTGLGLSTTMAIVKSHGGFINLYSEMGKGTTFKVYVPAANATALESENVTVEQTQLPRGNGELVLVVDDEESIRRVAQATLERFGYHVLLAAHGAEAVALYAQHRDQIDLVLTDMAMPIMDGLALIVALRAINPSVKVVGSSGLTSNGGVTSALGAGVRRFVPKPYTAETILKILAEELREPL